MIGVLLAATIAAPPCTPGIALDGDPLAVARVRDALGSASVGDGACPAIRASVERSGEAWVVSSDGASLTVHEFDAALAWIESRLRTDLAEPLLDPSILAEPAAVETVAARPGPSTSIEVGARAELAFTNVGSEAGAAAVLALGLPLFEPALVVRAASSGRIESPGLAPARRWSAEVLA
ncbi:MAG TPA: hypothetical protein VGD74_06005, partial [Vulgatibacter sp.]